MQVSVLHEGQDDHGNGKATFSPAPEAHPWETRESQQLGTEGQLGICLSPYLLALSLLPQHFCSCLGTHEGLSCWSLRLVHSLILSTHRSSSELGSSQPDFYRTSLTHYLLAH